MLVAAAGGPAVLPQATLVDQGYKGQVYQTHGAADARLHPPRRQESRAR